MTNRGDRARGSGADSLGLERRIARRDFVGGVALAAVASGLPGLGNAAAEPAGGPPAVPPEPGAYYPPLRTGLRGQHPGSFEEAHRVRDGAYAGPLRFDADTGEHYDLVVVGAGISGLSSAYFFRQALGPDVRVLLLDNHDDFGGHAKRNEFRHDGRIYLAQGGTESIETPFPYSHTARALLDELGIDVASWPQHLDESVHAGLTPGVFFDREHFGADRLVPGYGVTPWERFFAHAPLPAAVRAELVRLHERPVDYLPGLDTQGKLEALRHMSYRQYLLEHARLPPAALPFFHGMAFRNNKRIDTCPAWEAARAGAPGFAGLKLSIESYGEERFFFHFPDGNATIARLLVNRLVPDAWPAQGRLDMQSVVTAPLDYARLDTAANPTRIRLNSTVVRVLHEGEPGRAGVVDVVYHRDGRLARVRGDNVVLACWNNIVPHLMPELPAVQRQALGYASKVPMQYSSILLRNRRAWQSLGVSSVYAPNGYHTSFGLTPPVALGEYRPEHSPDAPVTVHMERNPNRPGLPRREQQRLGRIEMLTTPFEQIEREIRQQLARTLGPGGFDPARDILAITVNRWPHGYAYTYDSLADPSWADEERPHVIGRRRFGRVAIANADAGAAAFTNVAIDQAERAIQDVLTSRGLV